MKALAHYQKTKRGDDKIVHATSVKMTKAQYDFVVKFKINVSQVTRDAIDALIAETKQEVDDV